MGKGSADEDKTCAKCGKVIQGKAMKAKDVLFCEETCFICHVCHKDLKAVPVYCKDGKLYCEPDYKDQFLPKCCKCMAPIAENCIKAMAKVWHNSCFCCFECGRSLASADGIGYHEHNDRPFCSKCYTDNVLPKCKGCSKPITDKALQAMNAKWHVACFVCKDCKTTFEGHKSFYTIDDLPVCGPCAGIKD